MVKFKYVSNGILIGAYGRYWFRKDIATKLINRDPNITFLFADTDTAEYNKLKRSPKAIENMAYKICDQHKMNKEKSIRPISNDEIDYLNHKKPSGRSPLYISEKLYYLLEEYYQKKRHTTNPELMLLSIRNYPIPLVNSEDLTIYEQKVSNYNVEKFRAYLSTLIQEINLENQINNAYTTMIIEKYKYILNNIMSFVNQSKSDLKDKNATKGMALQSLKKAIFNYESEMNSISCLESE